MIDYRIRKGINKSEKKNMMNRNNENEMDNAWREKTSQFNLLIKKACVKGKVKHFFILKQLDSVVRGAFLKKWQLRWPLRRNI